MEKIIAEFKIPYIQYLDKDSHPVSELPAFAKDNDYLIKLYSAMVRSQVFDLKAITLQRTGKLGTYPSILGQEAIGIGVGAAMEATDVLCPYYRECGAQFWRGVKMIEILLYWGGEEQGSNFANQPYDFPICVPIASQTLHAVGVATAFKLRHEPRAVVTIVGDGGTSRGDFYEAINLAGAWHLPVVFVINNNQWAISVPRKSQTAAETLAQKGIAGGVRSLQIDGDDIIAVKQEVHAALERARQKSEPTVIEAVSYRMGDHTTADDAKRYRESAELELHKPHDPVLRLHNYLVQQNVWDHAKEKALRLAVGEEVTLVVQEYLNTKPRRPETMFDHLYATLPHIYQEERDELARVEVTQHE